MTYQADLTRVENITALVDATVQRCGHWDILINTAGIIVRKPLAETTEDEYNSSFAINAKIPFFFMKEAFRQQKSRRALHQGVLERDRPTRGDGQLRRTRPAEDQLPLRR